jgi:hypothetical protein
MNNISNPKQKQVVGQYNEHTFKNDVLSFFESYGYNPYYYRIYNHFAYSDILNFIEELKSKYNYELSRSDIDAFFKKDALVHDVVEEHYFDSFYFTFIYGTEKRTVYKIKSNDVENQKDSVVRELKIMATQDVFNDVVELLDNFILENVVQTYDSNGADIMFLKTSNNGLDLDNMKIQKVHIPDLDLYYGKNFTEKYNGVVNNLKTTQSGIYIFHGNPGTGKTYLLRKIAQDLQHEVNNIIFIPSKFSKSLADPELISILSNNTDSVLLIEEADNAIKSRSHNPDSDAVDNLLQLTDGILNDAIKCRIVITFNQDLNLIDEALLRPGRLMFRHKFSKLPKQNVNEICDSIGKGKLNRDAYLSEIFNNEVESNVIDNDTYIGF